MDSSDESVYHSCPEDSESDDDVPQPPFLGSARAAPFYADSQTARVLVCLNAARIILSEILKGESRNRYLMHLRGEATVVRILSICARWIGPLEEDTSTILALPLFQSSLASSRSETCHCSLPNINGLLSHLEDQPGVAIILGRNDTLTVAAKSSAWIVFNPQCRVSRDMGGASLRYFSNIDETVRHVYNIISIHRGSASNSPDNIYAGHILGPVAPSASHETRAVYQSNIRVLQGDRELVSVAKRELLLRAEFAGLEAELEREFMEYNEASTRTRAKLAESEAAEADLQDVHSVTAALLEGPSASAASKTDEELPTDKSVSEESCSTAQVTNDPPQSPITSPTDSVRSHKSDDSTPPTSPETLWTTNVNQQAEPIKETDDADAALLYEASMREALRLQAEMDAEEASMTLAQSLFQEDSDALERQKVAEARRNNPKEANLQDSRYLDPRKRAREAGETMGICFAEAAEAYENDDHARAKEVSNEGKRHQVEMDEWNRQAADWIYQANNPHPASHEIDLQGLFVKEAIVRVEQAVQAAILRRESEIHLVVGRGLDSPGGFSKLRSAIAELMTKYQLVTHVHPLNTGVLVVRLNESQAEGTMDANEIQRRLEGKDEQCIIM